MRHSKKRINGHYYWYLQHSRRIGKRVKTESWYVAPVGAAFSVIRVGVALAAHKAARDKVFMPVEDVVVAKAHIPTMPFAAGGLAMSTQLTAEQSFLHESGIENTAPSGAATPSSSEK